MLKIVILMRWLGRLKVGKINDMMNGVCSEETVRKNIGMEL